MAKLTCPVKRHNRKIAYDVALGVKILSNNPKYVGNPFHKRNPGNFNLTPPSCATTRKNLCDDVAIFNRNIAQQLLEDGLRHGFFSVLMCNGWPRNVWALFDNKIPLEARLDQYAGTYHGFPMDRRDPLYMEIIKNW